MKKTTTKYVCTECGNVSPGWLGKCSYCGKFGTIVEEIVEQETNSNKKPLTKTELPVKLSSVENEKIERFPSGIKEFDNVLGGGIVPYSIVLIGGDPGIGKSTILTEVAGNVAKNKKVLYVSAEESLSQIKMRCERLKVNSENLYLLNECCLDNIETISNDYDFIIIDSIQTVYLSELSSSAGTVTQVKECASKLMRLAKTNHKTVFVIGHVTKEGSIAGPKVLEHIMDTVLYFEGEPSENLKILRAVKNRFGSLQEVGVFEMTDAGIKGVNDFSSAFLSDNRGSSAGSIATPSISGNRCMPVEVQSLISKSIFGMPRRMPLGIDYNRMVLIIAVLERKAYIPLYNQDVYLNAMGGIKLTEPAVDLAVALSLASASKNIAIPSDVTCFGELGLTGEVRAVNFSEKRVLDSIKFGFKTILIPQKNYEQVKKYSDKIKIVPIQYVSQAIKFLFSE